MTLALLITAVTGAMATTDPNAVYWDYQTWKGWAESVTTHTVGDITITATGSGKVYQSTSSGEPLALQAGANDAITFTSNGKPFASIVIITDRDSDPGIAGWTWDNGYNIEWSGEPTTSVTLSGCDIKADYIIFTFGTAEAPITVEPVTGQQNQWTFTMPGSDVVLTPIYAKAAAFATTGTGSEVKTLLPEAAEGVIAGTDAPLIKEGTGIVAFAGESNEETQGTLMYAVTPATVTEAPALDAANKWSADVPTAKTVPDDGADVLVWYYIQGADAPEGDAATLDNTFSDTEPACLTVQVLSNKFDIQFNAANANTIEAGKATVTVAGAAATVTDGKLQGVKMGSEVKLEAKPGYKFRKVEVKKKEALIVNPEVGQYIGSDGKNYDANATLPDCVTKVAMITYVGSETGVEGYTNGLALALSDKGTMDWTSATGASGAAASTPAAPTPMTSSWMLPSKDQWNKMITAAGGYANLKTKAGLQDDAGYWSSTESSATAAWEFFFYTGSWYSSLKTYNSHALGCLAF